MTVNGLMARFTIALKVSLMAGVVGACPVWLYQLWAFLAPGLHRHEKSTPWASSAPASRCSSAAPWLAYAILPTRPRGS